MPTSVQGKIFNSLFPPYFDESDILRTSCTEDELEEDLDGVLM